MTTTQTAGGPRDAAVRAIERMKANWRGKHIWDEHGRLEAEYGRALTALGDTDLITEATTEAIRTVTGNFPPPVADLLAIADRCRARAVVAKSRPRQPDVSITAGALQDAITALHTAPHDEQERAYLEDQVRSLRRRLSDHGRRTDERMRDPNGPSKGLRWFTAEPHPDEDEDVRRLVVILPDDTRRPRSARVMGEGRGQVPHVVPGVPQQGMSALPASGRDDFPRGPLNGGAVAAVVAVAGGIVTTLVVGG